MEGENRLYRDWRILEGDYEHVHDFTLRVAGASLAECLDTSPVPAGLAAPNGSIGEQWGLFALRAECDNENNIRFVEIDDDEVQRDENQISPVVAEPEDDVDDE